jgi:hypothetical protein
LAPQPQPPLVQLSAWSTSHAVQVPPALPHALKVLPGLHEPFKQQPFGQLLEVHTH